MLSSWKNSVFLQYNGKNTAGVSVFVFNFYFIRCSVEQQAHKKEKKQLKTSKT